MDFKAAIDALRKLENGAELVSAIEAETNRLETKAFDVIGESRKATAKNRALTETLEAVGKLLGIEGDVDAIATNLDGKLRAITTELGTLKTEKTTLEARATEAEGRVKNLERQGKLSQIATKTGADAKALERLLGDKLDEIAVADDGVKVGDKAWREYVEASDDLKPFASVLLPVSHNEPKRDAKEQPRSSVPLPSGSPKGEAPQASDPVATYSSRNYGGIKAFVKSKS